MPQYYLKYIVLIKWVVVFTDKNLQILINKFLLNANIFFSKVIRPDLVIHVFEHIVSSISGKSFGLC